MGKGTWDELSKLINKYIKRNKSKEGVVGLFTKKQIGEFPSIGSRMTNPLNRGDLTLTELTRERQYFLFKNYEKDVLKDIIKVLEHVEKNNIKLGGELLKNLEYNFNIVKGLRKYNLKSEGILRSGGKNPKDVLKAEAKINFPGDTGITTLRAADDLQSSVEELMRLADELKPETIAKKEAAEKAIRAEEFDKLYHGRAYKERSAQYRGLSYQLVKLHEAGIIKLDPKIYKGIKEGKYHWGGAEFHTPDPNRVWRYHFGDDIFDKFDEVLEKGDDTFVGPKAMEEWLMKNQIRPIKVQGPENALNYMDEVELIQNIKNNDRAIKLYKSGKDHFWSGMDNEAENVMQSIMGLAKQNKDFLDILQIKALRDSTKKGDYADWYNDFMKTRNKKPEKTLDQALKDGDINIIKEGDEGFDEITERLGITARPGDNLPLEDNVIQGPWKGTKAPVTHQEKIDWLVKNVSQTGETGIPPKATLEAMLKDGREDLIDHFFELHTKNLGKPKINIDTSDLKHPELVKKMMTDEKLKPTEVKKVDLSKYDDDALNALVVEDTKLLAEANKLSEAGENYGRVKAIEVRRKEIAKILKAAQDVPESGYDNFKADLSLNKQTGKVTYSITDHIEYIKTFEPIEAMKEANKMLKSEGRYKGLSKTDRDQIIKDTEDHIFERDIPEDPDFAQGGRVGYNSGSDPGTAIAEEVREAWKDYLKEKEKGTFKGSWKEFQPIWIRANLTQGGRVGYAYGPSPDAPVLDDIDEGFDDMEEIMRMLKQDQTGVQGTTSLGQGNLDDLLQRLRMVVEGQGIYSSYNQIQRKQMQRSLTNRINVLLAQ